jgi:hypothetical protein
MYHILEDLGADRKIIFKIYLREVRSKDVNWIELAQDNIQSGFCNHAMNLRVP